jgi:hypothetical protein
MIIACRKLTRQALAEQIGADGRSLLTAIWSPEAPAWLRKVPAIRTMHRAWLQQYYAAAAEEPTRWRVSPDWHAPEVIHTALADKGPLAR